MIRYMVVLGCSVNLIRATLCPLSNRKTRRLAAKFQKKCLNRNGTGPESESRTGFVVGQRAHLEADTISANLAAAWPRSITDRKSTRLNSSHVAISYAVFCLKKKNHEHE